MDITLKPQGLHDSSDACRKELQPLIDAVEPKEYAALFLGYGLCNNAIAGIRAGRVRLVIPRAHDCITFFLGSKERYQECFNARPGTYYYTSGWLECAKRRGSTGPIWGDASLPAGANASLRATYEQWVQKYGEDQAKYLLEEMGRWTDSYSHGTLITFDFVKHLKLKEEVRQICTERGWQYDEIPGDLGMFHKLLDGEWPEADFLIVRPGQEVIATNNAQVIGVQAGGN
jgi:hypothetical protein